MQVGTSAGIQGRNPEESAYLNNYYEHLNEEDSRVSDEADLVVRARRHHELGRQRSAGESIVRVETSEDATTVYLVGDDKPYLIDSAVAEILRHAQGISTIFHPIFLASRDEYGALLALKRADAGLGTASGDTSALPVLSEAELAGNVHVESWASVRLTQVLSDEEAVLLREGLERILEDVSLAYADQEKLRSLAGSVVIDAQKMAESSGPRQASSQQAQEFFEWLLADHFIFLGYREYDLRDGVLTNVPGSGAGIQRNEADLTPRPRTLGPRSLAMATSEDVLTITKANKVSTVHRAAYLDYVSLKTFDDAGQMREKRFIGLFTARSRYAALETVPVLREKRRAIQKHFGFPENSHSGASLESILQGFPREELFQMTMDELIQITTGILGLEERRRTRLFLRRDASGRFASALVYLPRDRFSTSVRLRLQRELEKAYAALPEETNFSVDMTESVLTRLFFRLRLTEHTPAHVDVRELESKLAVAGRSWAEGYSQVAADLDEVSNSEWMEAFPEDYRVSFQVEDALEDTQVLMSLPNSDELHARLRIQEQGGTQRVKLYVNQALSLSQIMPMLHQFGFEIHEERPFEVTPESGRSLYIYDLLAQIPENAVREGLQERLQDAIEAQLSDRAESDAFDALVLTQGLSWRMVTVFRAFAKYMRQSGVSNTYTFMSQVLVDFPEVTASLVKLFTARFNPEIAEGSRDLLMRTAGSEFDAAIEAVPTLDAERILRMFRSLTLAADRTNFYLDLPRLSFKLRPKDLDFSPEPKPLHEIWVYSPQVEGVHLRFGDIARGGLRWSDRKEDFRTEVLGLVKAQAVKNAVIVPDGAKGGFFAKQLPDPSQDRGTWMEAGKDAYRSFIRGLLDITDNRQLETEDKAVVAPQNVVRHDGDDPYLVVAADKGTASFSDIANAISEEYGFWLGDAFASGGSVGYDHKAMAITARGAWESVKRHFAHLGIDCQKEDFTAVGVGDMSGDVFGNGMLRSRHTRLIAAFDHRDIFIDPNPVAASSFTERQRLFDLPRSSWADYDKSLISVGGGVYPRSSKSIDVSAEAAAALGIEGGAQKMAPNALMSAILKAPVDLVYNGGIGTYIKASSESHDSVGDRANDALRINGCDVRAKIIGEGGNLGMTQAGRVEAALGGVLLNTDAIDNSAGVDCSDHEVNIKILVDQLVASGDLEKSERTDFLLSMTEEVGHLVLETNIAQNILLQADAQRALLFGPSLERQIQWLETRADLNRSLEFLPSTSELEARQRAGKGLTSPELAVVAAYAKMQLARALAKSDFVQDPILDDVLENYFPAQIRERFSDQLQKHPLRDQIIATLVANEMVNIGGTSFVYRVMEETTLPIGAVAKAFMEAVEVYGLRSYMKQFSELPAHFELGFWHELITDMRRLLDRATRWLLSHSSRDTDIQSEIDQYRPVVKVLQPVLSELVVGEDRERVQAWYTKARKAGAPEELAQSFSGQFESFAMLDIADIAEKAGMSARKVAEMYYAVYARFDIDATLTKITDLDRDDRWQTLARAALRDDLYSIAAELTRSILIAAAENSRDGDTAAQVLAWWEEENDSHLRRALSTLEQLQDRSDMASLSVILRMLRSIVSI